MSDTVTGEESEGPLGWIIENTPRDKDERRFGCLAMAVQLAHDRVIRPEAITYLAQDMLALLETGRAPSARVVPLNVLKGGKA